MGNNNKLPEDLKKAFREVKEVEKGVKNPREKQRRESFIRQIFLSKFFWLIVLLLFIVIMCILYYGGQTVPNQIF